MAITPSGLWGVIITGLVGWAHARMGVRLNFLVNYHLLNDSHCAEGLFLLRIKKIARENRLFNLD